MKKSKILPVILAVFLSPSAFSLTVNDVSLHRLELFKKPATTPVKWQSLKANEKMAITQFLEYMTPVYKVCNGNTFVRTQLSSVYQINKPKVSVYIVNRKLDAADQLNGVTWKGAVTAKVTGAAIRELSSSAGQWKSDWHRISINYPSKLQDNKLQYDNTASDYMYGMRTNLDGLDFDCSQIELR